MSGRRAGPALDGRISTALDAARTEPGGVSAFAPAALRLSGQAGVLFGWGPEGFWTATPAELGVLVAVLAGEGGAAAPLGGAELARLKERYPDG